MVASSQMRPAPLAHLVAGTGERIVLVHGFTQSAASWQRVFELLASRFEVVALDLPGHGGSSRVRPADLAEQALLIGATGGRATYVGYSLGGRSALCLALQSPELVERLVLVGATSGIADPLERAARVEADEALARAIEQGGDEGIEAFLQHWLEGPLFSHLDARAANIEARRVNGAAGLAASLRSCGAGTQVPSWDRLEGLVMPVLVVAGARDAKFCALADRLADAIGANATKAIVEAVGHAVPFEGPDAFANLVAAFVEAARPNHPR